MPDEDLPVSACKIKHSGIRRGIRDVEVSTSVELLVSRSAPELRLRWQMMYAACGKVNSICWMLSLNVMLEE